jgi:hypothetical protein
MRTPLSLARIVAVCGLPLLFLTGCGSQKTVKVSGKLVLPSQIKLADNDSVMVTFTPDEDIKAQGGSGTVSPSALTFDAAVPPGKYKVSVTIQSYPGAAENKQRSQELTKFSTTYSLKSTPLRYEVTAEANQAITIDLSKPPGTITKN